MNELGVWKSLYCDKIGSQAARFAEQRTFNPEPWLFHTAVRLLKVKGISSVFLITEKWEQSKAWALIWYFDVDRSPEASSGAQGMTGGDFARTISYHVLSVDVKGGKVI